MQILDILILAAVGLWLGLVVFAGIRGRKRGRTGCAGCCGSCGGCAADCAPPQTKKSAPKEPDVGDGTPPEPDR